MIIRSARLWQVRLPLVTPFRTAIHTETDRPALVLRIETDDGFGWAECSVDETPVYGSEFAAGTIALLESVVMPALLGREIRPATVQPLLEHLRGHHALKSAVELAVIDAWCRSAEVSLQDYLGGVRDRVDVGVSIGLQDDDAALIRAVEGYLGEGYRRIKLKIGPGHDVRLMRAVRAAFGDELMLQADANASYTMADLPAMMRLDGYHLSLLEQPLAHDDLVQHAALARQLRTPICLDESIASAGQASAALSLGSAGVVNIKPARVGGYLEARRIHDICRAAGVPVWCGGMLETGIGRAANLALASLPGFTLPSDISATSRYFRQDITDHFELDGGTLTVPTGPGIGVPVREDVIADLAIGRWEWNHSG